MSNSLDSAKSLVAILMLLAGVSGCCCQAIPLPAEKDCPTDARRLYLTCGEEAVRRCPCGPDREYYGHKPTSWRAWPDGWRCRQEPWGDTIGGDPCSESCDVGPDGEAPCFAVPLEMGQAAPNPFADDVTTADSPPANSPVEPLPAVELLPTEIDLPDSDSAESAPAPPTTPAAVEPPSPPVDVNPVETPATGASQKSAAPEATMDTTQAPAITTQAEAPKAKAAPPAPAPVKHTTAAPVRAAAPAVKSTPVEKAVATTPAGGKRADDEPRAKSSRRAASSLSNRVQQHLTNNLAL